MPPVAKTKAKPGTGSSALGGGLSPLAQARSYLTKKLDKEFTSIRVTLDADSLKDSLPHISSGCDVVDYLIGGAPNKFGVAPCPGFPRGRVTQIWGHESAGKTTICLQAAADSLATLAFLSRYRSSGTNSGQAVQVNWEALTPHSG